MKSTFIVIVLALGSLFSAGCSHTRTSAFTSVGGEVQKIKTRNRYTLVGFKHEGQNPNADVMKENLYTQQFSNDNLKKYQPEVFADDGIRFSLRAASLCQNTANRYGWTTFFPYLLTLTALPQFITIGTAARCTVDVLDNPDARATFDSYSRYDQALALLTPTPLLCYVGDAAPPDGLSTYSVVSEHTVSCAFVQIGSSASDHDEAVRAYAIAAVLKKMEDDGLIDESRACSAVRRSTQALSIGDMFEIVDFKKEGSSDRRYSFALRRRQGGGISLRESRELQKSLRAMIREDYAASFPDVAAGAIVVDFLEFSLRDGMVRGVSEVLSFAVESLRYDPNTRVGVMRAHIGENQFEEARRYVRRNIESLVRDKNVALDGKAIPPTATFYLCGETLKGDVLEITFRTE